MLASPLLMHLPWPKPYSPSFLPQESAEMVSASRSQESVQCAHQRPTKLRLPFPWSAMQIPARMALPAVGFTVLLGVWGLQRVLF